LKRNHWVGLVISGLLMASMVAGCGTTTKPSTTPSTTKPDSNANASTNTLSGQLTAMGSTALQPLVAEAAKEFEAKYPKVTVQVSGGGSFSGLSQAEAGSVDIGDSDVFATSNMTDLVDHQVAIVPFVLAVNPDVTAANVTQQQAKDIFTGKIKNWKDIGGKNEPIVIINRPKSSGTRATIQKIVLGGANYATGMDVQDSTGAVKTAIANTKGAIGAIGGAYVDSSVKALSYEGVAFTATNAKNGTYKIVSPEHMYTKGQPTKLGQAFLDFILSKDFQGNAVPQLKFVTINK